MSRLLAAAIAIMTSSAALAGGTVTFNFGAGFSDTTIVPPVGGNNGTTLGQQRQNLFMAAGQIWADIIDSPVPIVIDAQFSDLQCDAGGAVLGSAGATVNSTNFSLMSGLVFYPASLQNALLGSDQFPLDSDVDANFNANIDAGSCPGFTGFYYGLDNNAPPNQPLLFATVLHEIAHGLGFSAAIAPDGSYPTNMSGTEIFGIYDFFMFDVDDNEFITDLSVAERAASLLDDPNLVWTGDAVTNNFASFVNAGSNSGNMRLYAPPVFEGGSSISHFTTDATPDLLMEPVQGNLAVGQTDLTPFLFQDLGYTVIIPNPAVIFLSSFEAGETPPP